MPSYAPYSFSKLAQHDGCNRQFKYARIDKIPEGPRDMTALLKGGAIHSIIEHYPNPTKHKLAPKYQHIADKFIKSGLGTKYLTLNSTREFSFGLTHDLKPCKYSDKQALFRGSIDYVTVIDGVINLIDWKSGKPKELRWQNFNQLMFYAVYFFIKYPDSDKIRISYVYVEHDDENDIILERKYLNNYIDQLNTLIKNLETDTVFKKNKTKLCDWCPFQNHCDKDIDT